MTIEDPLTFKVAPHIVEDLGLNLYTELPRVLAEFIANAYDADSDWAEIVYDHDAVSKARKAMKTAYEAEVARAPDRHSVPPLTTRTLDEQHTIVIKDAGHGMSRDDLAQKFLVAGRRRRVAEPNSQGRTPEKHRPLMGRKGLGKFAGFGVAKRVTVLTRKKGESHATRIELDYDSLISKHTSDEVRIPDTKLPDGGGIDVSGTIITLSRLLYDPVKSLPTTITQEIGEHFELLDDGEFRITFNGHLIPRMTRKHVFAWPKPDVPIEQYVDHQLDLDEGGSITFKYRLRFTGKNEALMAARRGVRVYAHRRLAAAPSLLDADTNMHGFRQTDYLDGSAIADFIDDQKEDYVATDRNNLRWESPLLGPFRAYLSGQIREACKEYQKFRDAQDPKEAENDSFTIGLINNYGLTGADKKMAFRFAAILLGVCKKGVNDVVYKERLPVLIQSIGQGTVFAAISQLAAQDHPDLHSVANEITKLAAKEWDQFVTSARSRLKAIEALRKIVRDDNFKNKPDDKKIQKLLESSPWLIDPTYTQFLLADTERDALYDSLAKELGVAHHAPSDDEERPDLVFFLYSSALGRLVIVVLKPPNIQLDMTHLIQLQGYMQQATKWLRKNAGAVTREVSSVVSASSSSKGSMSTGVREPSVTGYSAEPRHIQVSGHLIGTMAPPESTARQVLALERAIETGGPDTGWRVRDFMHLLDDAESAHRDLIDPRSGAATT